MLVLCFKFLIAVFNRPPGLSAEIVVLVFRFKLLTVASSCADGLTVVVLEVVEVASLEPPPHEAKKMVMNTKKGLSNLFSMLVRLSDNI